MSVAVSLSAPRACSGDQYSGVPSSIPWVVTLVDERAMRARPKSETTTRPVALSISTFPGVRSRWTIPRAWAYASADAIGRAISDACAQPSRPVPRHIREIRPVDELHDEKRRLAVLAVVVEAHDVLVHERRQDAGLAREPAPELEILGDPRVEQLDGDVAAQAAVVGPPDRAHAPLADASLELVAAGDEVGHAG